MRRLGTTLAVAAIVIGGCGSPAVKPRCAAGQCVDAAAGSTGTDAPATAPDATDTPVTPDAGDASIVPADAGPDVPVDMGGGLDAPRVDGPVVDSPGADTAGTDVRVDTSVPEVPICPTGQNKCGSSTSCLNETGTACGPSCTRCAAPTNGVPTCTTGACGQECRIDGGVSYACATDCCPAKNEWIQNRTDVRDMAMAMDAAIGKAHVVYANDQRLWYAERGAAGGWRYRTIDPESGPYSGVSIALDAAGRPHVAYSRGIYATRYARLDNNAWTISAVDATGGSYSSIALAGDKPRIVYETYNDNALHHASWDGTSWTRELLTRPSQKGSNPSLAVDSTGASRVAYVEVGQGYLWLATRGTSWSYESIGPSGTAGGWPSLALGAGDEPRVAYTDRTGILAYAERNAGAWTVSAPDPMGGGAHNALRLDSRGAPVISYMTNPVPVTSTVWYLMVARRAAPGWSLTQLGYVGTYLRTDMGLDAMDRPYVAYLDERYSTTEHRLRFVPPTPSGAAFYEDVDGMLSVGQALSLKLDTAGRARLAYLSDAPIGREEGGSATTFRSLWYAEQVSGGWNIESVDMAGTAAAPSMVLDGAGNVSVAYQAAKKLVWARRQAIWSWTFEPIDGASDTGEFASAALDGTGRASVSYFDRANGDLKLATNSSGSWKTSVVDATGVTGVGTSLALDAAGAPRIAYYDQTATRLRYAFATGTTWTLETADAMTATDLGQFPSLALDAAGVAHVAYFDATHSRIRYASRDPSWSAQTLDPPWSGWSTSLALGPGGAPRIAAVDDHVNKTIATGTSAAYTLYLRWNNGIWVVSRVTQSMWAPYPVALAVDAQDRPRIATPNIVLSYVP